MSLTRLSETARSVVITGASSGIGAALAERLAARGDRLAIIARRADRLETLADQLEAQGSVRPVVIVADLASRGEAAEAGRKATDALGRVDVLVNNAGGGAGGTIWRSADGSEARDAFEVNHWAPLALISVIVPEMVARRSGTVVNITSMAQVMTWPMMGPYTATKAALASATEALRLELRGTGVNVLEVIPGPVDTAVQAESALLPGFESATRRAPLGDPVELARRIERSIERGRKRLVYPRSLALAYWLPGGTRAYIRWAARGVEDVVEDERLLRSGSQGDPDARAARAEWERRRDRQRQKGRQ